MEFSVSETLDPGGTGWCSLSSGFRQFWEQKEVGLQDPYESFATWDVLLRCDSMILLSMHLTHSIVCMWRSAFHKGITTAAIHPNWGERAMLLRQRCVLCWYTKSSGCPLLSCFQPLPQNPTKDLQDLGSKEFRGENIGWILGFSKESWCISGIII